MGLERLGALRGWGKLSRKPGNSNNGEGEEVRFQRLWHRVGSLINNKRGKDDNSKPKADSDFLLLGTKQLESSCSNEDADKGAE